MKDFEFSLPYRHISTPASLAAFFSAFLVLLAGIVLAKQHCVELRSREAEKNMHKVGQFDAHAPSVFSQETVVTIVADVSVISFYSGLKRNNEDRHKSCCFYRRELH